MIDVDHQISAARRRVGSRLLEAGEARVMTISQAYDAEVEDVWDACTNPERIPRWFLPVTGDLRVGGRYQLEGHAGGVVESCEPPTRFTATWEYGDDVSWIEVSLAPEDGGGTRLVLEHISHVDERWTEFGPGAVGVGWEMALIGLTLHLGSGEAVDPGAFEQWTASADGKRFVTLSSERWGEASAAGGTPAADAEAAAARTTAAYTGEPPPEG